MVHPYLVAWIRFIDDTGFRVEMNEQFVFHDRYFYAGTLDRVGLLNGVRSVIDIKTVAVLGPHTGVQLAAYQEALNSNLKKADHINKRFAVQLKPDSTYRLQPYTDKSDFSVFTSLLNIHNWRQKHAKQYTRS